MSPPQEADNRSIYSNSGNQTVVEAIPAEAIRILDVGCGAGDNARLIRALRPYVNIVGITHNAREAQLASPYLSNVYVFDLEQYQPSMFPEHIFDVIVFSHVLEHLRDPVSLIRNFVQHLVPGGHVIVAVPNTLEWRTRLHFLRGNFRYSQYGILDRTHLRFFTYSTAAEELIFPVEGLVLKSTLTSGSAPLGNFLRRVIPESATQRLDQLALKAFPNLFSQQVVLISQHQR